MPQALSARRFQLGRLARLARPIGWIAVAASLAFVGHRLWLVGSGPLAATLADLGPLIAAGSVVYGLAGFLLAEAWYLILGPGSAGRLPHHAVYGRTQIAKYLPGNLFHFAGRQVLGRRLGHSQSMLARASLLEMASLFIVAGALSLSAAAPGFRLWAAIALITTVAGIALIMARWRPPGRREHLRNVGLSPRSLLAAGGLHAVFFAIAGAILWVLVVHSADPTTARVGLLASISALALAWIAGFITPGSSAGIGVREAALIAILSPALGASMASAAALALRLVTTLGDGLFFTLALALPLPATPPGRPCGPERCGRRHPAASAPGHG